MILNLAKMAAVASKAEKYDTLMAELRTKVECPVCLAVPTKGPMASCPKGHLVCIPCHQTMVASRLTNCPTCREPMGDTMNLLAKVVIENIEHECTNQGCNMRLPYQKVTKHKEELCKYRMVLCPGANPECKATLPFSTFNDHAKVCKSVGLLNVGQKTMSFSFKKTLLDGNVISWKSVIYNIDNEVFVVQKKMAEGKFTFAVLMLAERAKCERFKVTLAINNLLDQTVFSAQFNPTPISMKNVEEASLVVHKQRFAKMVSNNGDMGDFEFDCEIKVSQKRALIDDYDDDDDVFVID